MLIIGFLWSYWRYGCFGLFEASLDWLIVVCGCLLDRWLLDLFALCLFGLFCLFCLGYRFVLVFIGWFAYYFMLGWC